MFMRNGKTDVRLLTGGFIAALFACLTLYLSSPQVRADSDHGSTKEFSKLNYSEFPHNTKAHRLECSKCHKFPSSNWKTVRKGSDAFPDITDYPKHDSCVGCHMQQFFKGATPKICSICHTNPGPRNGSRHPFPNPREIFDQSAKGKKAESDFVVSFPHDKHIEIVSANSDKPVSFRNAAFVPKPLRLGCRRQLFGLSPNDEAAR